jgi:endoglucanase
MRRSDLTWLLALTHLPSISGHEDRVVSFVRDWVGRRDDLRVRADRSGNLWVTQARRSRRVPLYVTAHMDHPGFLVTAVAGRDAEVEFRGGVRSGYFEDASLHFFGPDSHEPVGARLTNYDPATKSGTIHVRRGTVEEGWIGRWAFPSRSLGVKGDRLHAPGCDDLAGVAAALSFLDRARKKDGLGHVGVLLTRAEEVGLVGAIAASREGSIRADARLLCLETSRSYAESPIGGGPVVRVGDRLTVFDAELTNRVSEVATRHGKAFPWQRKLMPGGVCEASVFAAYGYASTCICLPLGNYHNMGNLDEVERGTGDATPKPEVISLSDHDGLIRLLLLVAEHLDEPGVDVRSRLEDRFDGAVLERPAG